eukprot:1142390-Pelagomonas_calceolata.AAC.1
MAQQILQQYLPIVLFDCEQHKTYHIRSSYIALVSLPSHEHVIQSAASWKLYSYLEGVTLSINSTARS